MSDEKTNMIFSIAIAIAALMLALSFLIASLNMASEEPEFSNWFVIVLQAFWTLMACIGGLTLVNWLLSNFKTNVAKRVSDLEGSQKEILAQINKKKSPFLVSSLLIGSMVLLVADKSFQGTPSITIVVGLGLCVLFWVANELLTSSRKLKRYLGGLLWVVGILILPIAVYISRGCDYGAVHQSVVSLGLGPIVMIIFTFLVALVGPAIAHGDG